LFYNDYHEVHRPLQLVIVEDESLFRDMLTLAMQQDGAIKVVGSFRDGESALAACPSLQPHAAIIDIGLPGAINGVQLVLKLRSFLPGLGIVLLSNYKDPAYLKAVPAASLAGWSYLLKKSVYDTVTLRRAVLGSAAGLMVLDPALVTMKRKYNSPFESLTPRQEEILSLIAQGYSNAAIAKSLALSPKTVENHISQLIRSWKSTSPILRCNIES